MRQKPEDLLSPDQMKLMADVWTRPAVKPRYVHGQCECGHCGTIDTSNGLCMWCQPLGERSIDPCP
jgi:hypothetical protein